MMCLLLVALLLSLCLFTSGWVVAPVSPSALKSQKSSSRAPRCAALWCTAAPDVAAEAADSNLQVEADVDADEAPSSYSTFRIDLEKPIGLLLDEIPGKPGVRVAGTVEGGSAAASGAISEGMQLMSVYGEDCRNLTFDEVCELINTFDEDVLNFELKR